MRFWNQQTVMNNTFLPILSYSTAALHRSLHRLELSKYLAKFSHLYFWQLFFILFLFVCCTLWEKINDFIIIIKLLKYIFDLVKNQGIEELVTKLT